MLPTWRPITGKFIFAAAPLLLLLLASGCSVDQTPVVKGRAQQFVNAFFDKDYDACANMIAPSKIKQMGTDGAKTRLQFLAGVMNLGNITADKVRIDEVIVSEDRTTADVKVSVNVNDVWKSIDPQRWIVEEGDWYLSI